MVTAIQININIGVNEMSAKEQVHYNTYGDLNDLITPSVVIYQAPLTEEQWEAIGFKAQLKMLGEMIYILKLQNFGTTQQLDEYLNPIDL